MNLARSLGSVGGLTLVSRILALVRDSLQARYVGANFASDAFLVAFRLPNMVIPALTNYANRGNCCIFLTVPKQERPPVSRRP